jgi:hypothetical protein
MTDLEECAACAEVAEKTVGYAFSPVTPQKLKSLITNDLVNCDNRKKGGPKKMQVYPTMCMKTKGKKLAIRDVYRSD